MKMKDRLEMIDVVLPSYIKANPGVAPEKLRDHLEVKPLVDLEKEYFALTPLDQQTEAQIAAAAERAGKLYDIEQKNKQRQQQGEAQARAQFTEIAKQLGISDCESNFRLAYDTLRPSLFNAEDIRGFIERGQ